MTLPAFTAERWRLQHGVRRRRSISAADAGAQVAAAAAAVDRWDRQTDKRTPDCYTVTAPHNVAYDAGSINNTVVRQQTLP